MFQEEQSVWATGALRQSAFVVLCVLWCSLVDHKFGLEIQNFGHAVQSGAVVVIVTGDETHAF